MDLLKTQTLIALQKSYSSIYQNCKRDEYSVLRTIYQYFCFFQQDRSTSYFFSAYFKRL